MDIGTRLKKARAGKASQQQIADLLKTTQQQVSKYENNIQEIPCRIFRETAAGASRY